MQDEPNTTEEQEEMISDTVETPTPSSSTSLPSVTGSDSTTQVLDLTGLINGHLSQIDHLKGEMGKLKEMLDSIFQNDPTYQTHDAAVKEAQKIRNGTKKQLSKLPQAADLTARIQDMKQHIKDLNDTLSEYIQDYARTTGQTSIETPDGQVKEIVYTAKLVNRSAKSQF